MVIALPRWLFLFFLAVVVLVLAPAYVSARLGGVMPWSRRWKLAVWLGVEALILPAPLLMGLSRTHSGPLVDASLGLSYLGLGLFSFLLFWTLVRDVTWVPLGIFILREPSRRNVWLIRSSGLVLIVSLACLGIGVAQALLPPRVVQVSVPVDGLHRGLDGFRIAHISDIHLSPWKDAGDLRRIVATINEAEPDLVAITGDFVDGAVTQRGHDAMPLRELSAPAFFVTGNHEHYSGAKDWISHLEGLGVIVLDGEQHHIAAGGATLLIAGLEDPAGGGVEARRNPLAVANGPVGVDFRLMLAHRPADAFAVSEAGFDLQLSGHTHGGQFFPYTLLIDLFQPFATGLHRHGNLFIFTSRGAGFWGPPVRFLNPPEIAVLTLER